MRRRVNLELKGITKRFGSLVANDHIDLPVAPGTIHALLGENGAGKSTLMNILYGLLQPDEGQIVVDGQPITVNSPRDALDAGIGMVHQHFMLVPVFTVAENVALRHEETKPLGWRDRRRMRAKVRELSEQYGLRVDPDALTEDLPVGVQQRVEILKALLGDARVLIVDEPTAVLTPGETEDLFRIMRELRASGKAIVFISHKLKEVQAIADTVTILRRGKVVGQRPPSTSEDELAALMMGRNVQLRVSKTEAKPGRIVLDVKDLVVPSAQIAVQGEEPAPAVNGITFRVRAGEILGIAGVQGNGQTELCEALMGLLPATSGSVHLSDRDITGNTPQARLRGGIGYIAKDRQQDGLVSSFPVSENIVLDTYDRRPYASGLALNLTAIRETAEERVKEFDIRAQSISTPVGTLSGGNQQKVILAREVGRDVSLLLASQPTRGLDVGSIEFVHKRIIEERDRGAAVILVSSELDEIYALSDRIAVMYEGRFTGFRPPDVPVEELGLLVAGIDGTGTTAEAPPGAGAESAGGGAHMRRSPPAPPGPPDSAPGERKAREKGSFSRAVLDGILQGN